MNSTNSVIEEHEPLQTVSVHHYSHSTPRIIHPRLSHQDTCESDAGLVEDIGIITMCMNSCTVQNTFKAKHIDTVNPEIFAKILFSGKALKDILAALKICD